MERKISLNLFYMGVMTAIAGIFITVIVYYGLFRQEVEQNLVRECRLVAQSYEMLDSYEELKQFSGDQFRITLIKNDGTILFESKAEPDKMQNHLNRPEIRSAIDRGYGSDTRYSDTIGTEDYYYAVRLDDENILRVSVQADSIFGLFKKSIMIILIVIGGIIVVSVFISVKLTEKLLVPLKMIPEVLEKNRPAEENGIYPELIPLLEEIRQVRNSQSQMRQEFTANVSHELKTPLTSISGYAELIETGMAKNEDTVKFAEKIHSEALRMLTLIGDIIRLSELDSTDHITLNDTIELTEIAVECMNLLEHSAKQKGIRITVAGNSESFKGNRTEMHELIYNLIDNAIKYNRENGNIDIEIENRRLTISDTGIGIPEESIPRIFERFYRADKSRSRAYGGTGLGLSIVKHIADHHHAEIEVSSTVNVGTQITIAF